MPQINIEVDEATASGLERAAGKRGLRRPDYLRALIRSGLDAEAAGREPFTAAATEPVLRPEAMSELLARLATLATELERVLTQNAKRDAALHRKTVAEDTAQAARIVEAEAGIRSRLNLALDPFRRLLDELHRAVLDHPALAQIDAAIRKLETSVRAPPPASHTYIEGLPMPTRWWHWPVAGLGLVFLGLLTHTIMARNLPAGVAVRLIDPLLPGDAAFHRLAVFRYGQDVCAPLVPPLPVSGATCKPVRPGRTVPAHRTAG